MKKMVKFGRIITACLVATFVACSNPGGTDSNAHTHVWGDWERVGVYPTQLTRRTCTVAGCNEQETFTGGSRVRASSVLGNMLWIPAGSFIMGSPDYEAGRFDPAWGWGSDERYEGPRRRVTLSGFYMSPTTVTRGQWRAVMGTSTPQESGLGAWGAGNNDHPVTHVNWREAIVFANLLSMQAGLDPVYYMETTTPGIWGTDPTDWGDPVAGGAATQTRWNSVRIADGNPNGYRLPTEAQWEYAARAGTITAFNDSVTNCWWFEKDAVRRATALTSRRVLSEGNPCSEKL